MYHPIIGIVVFALIAFQPALGYVHHRQFKRTQRRTLVSYLHLWNGRVLIVLGIVNGGLGLRVADAPDMAKLAYTIVAAVLGAAWLLVSLLSAARRGRGRDALGRRAKGDGEKGRNVRVERLDRAVRAGREGGGRRGGGGGRFM